MVETYDSRFLAETATELLADVTAVVDCTDNLPTRYFLQGCCVEAGLAYIWAAVGQYAGRCSVVLPSAPVACFECVYGPEESAGDWPSGAVGGIFGPVCGVVGSLAATEGKELSQ